MLSGISKTRLFRHVFTAGVVGMASDLVVFRQMLHQAKAAKQGFTEGHHVIAHVVIFMASNEGDF